MIDLGQKYDGCSPRSPSDEGKDKMHYPSLYFTADEDAKLPEEGEAKIKFRRVEKGIQERKEGEPKFRYELEVIAIEPIGAGRDGEPDLDIRKSLRKRAKEMEDEE